MAGRDDLVPAASAAFLLAQVGAHAATRFADRLAEHDLTPPMAGILRLLRVSPGLSQQAIAERLGVMPSRVVALLDDLELRGLLRRERSRADRRISVAVLTPAGTEALRTIRSVVQAHQAALLAGLSPAEQAALTALLQRIADGQDLSRGIHPGYGALRPGPASGH